MLSNVTLDIDIDVLIKVIIAIALFVAGLVALFVTFIVVKKNNKEEIKRSTVNDKITYLYQMYETGKITEAELKGALDKLLEEGNKNEKDS